MVSWTTAAEIPAVHSSLIRESVSGAGEEKEEEGVTSFRLMHGLMLGPVVLRRESPEV